MPVAPGADIDQWRQALRPDVVSLSAGHRLRPQDIRSLAVLSIDNV